MFSPFGSQRSRQAEDESWREQRREADRTQMKGDLALQTSVFSEVKAKPGGNFDCSKVLKSVFIRFHTMHLGRGASMLSKKAPYMHCTAQKAPNYHAHEMHRHQIRSGQSSHGWTILGLIVQIIFINIYITYVHSCEIQKTLQLVGKTNPLNMYTHRLMLVSFPDQTLRVMHYTE